MSSENNYSDFIKYICVHFIFICECILLLLSLEHHNHDCVCVAFMPLGFNKNIFNFIIFMH